MTEGGQVDPELSAKSARLRYVNDDGPGLRRERIGSGTDFTYVSASGEAVDDEATLARIRSLAIPPAWEKVWICPLTNGHIQATGRDARGRKQYRYHPRWHAVRDETKDARMAGGAAREGAGHDRPPPRGDVHPRGQRGVRAQEPLVRADDAAQSPRRRVGELGPLPFPRQERQAARDSHEGPPPGADRRALQRAPRSRALSIRRRRGGDLHRGVVRRERAHQGERDRRL